MGNSYEERADEEWLEVTERWLKLKEHLDMVKEEEQRLRAELIQLAKDRSCRGGGVRLLRSMRKGTVQYGEIPELKDVDLDKYRKPTAVSWNLARYQPKEST
ncbi:MAG: hypothetical protein SP1CHLAM54_10240 [Chlamydiia bacterium]|nr:hypothetical protein [Chlamydiia bacterium]MCH9615930.1 hypothetical protein [Chlamydiia bacterium]MCH9628667.1 hypothetical protein [Chlamydiia bacterium]